MRADVEGQGREAQAAQKRAVERYRDPERLLVVSLTDWLDVARKAGLPVIPATTVTRVRRRDLVAVWDQDKAARRRLDQAADALRAAADSEEHGTGVRQIWRLDYAAPGATKAWISSGVAHTGIAGGSARSESNLFADMRLAELTPGYPRAEVPVLLRPYVAPAMAEGWPVEYRVWIRHGRPRAVANYYPQRVLADNDATRAQMDRCVALATQLADAAPRFDSLPLNPDAEAEGVSFTADFLVDPQEEIHWLEAGPYTFPGYGAHPCTIEDPVAVFMPDEPQPLCYAFGQPEVAKRLQAAAAADRAVRSQEHDASPSG